MYEHREFKNIKNGIKAALKLLAAKVKGSAAVDCDNCVSVTKEDFDLHFFTDVSEPNEPIPRTYDECIASIRRIPSLIKGGHSKLILFRFDVLELLRSTFVCLADFTQ